MKISHCDCNYCRTELKRRSPDKYAIIKEIQLQDGALSFSSLKTSSEVKDWLRQAYSDIEEMENYYASKKREIS